jgi:uncharacterized protein YjiS (DUF1127 family)
MSHATEISERPSSLRRFARWWRNWNGRRRAILDLEACGSAEVERIARDVGVSRADLSILAGKWPDAADLLYWRMNEVHLDRKEVTQLEPDVMRDLQRVCTVCGSKRRCEHELAKYPSDPAWQRYCPNATTLSALVAERAVKAKANQSLCATTQRRM